MSNWTSPAIASQFYQFLEAYRLELSKKSRAPSSQSTSQWPEAGAGQVPDPTTANALSTSTVVLRKKSSNRRNSPFDGVPLSNYWIRHQDVRAEVYDWISHFLSLK